MRGSASNNDSNAFGSRPWNVVGPMARSRAQQQLPNECVVCFARQRLHSIFIVRVAPRADIIPKNSTISPTGSSAFFTRTLRCPDRSIT